MSTMHPSQMAHHHDASDHEQMMQEQHRSVLWAHFVNIALGFWLLSSPFTFGYLTGGLGEGVDALRATIERDLPSIDWRNQAMAWSDFISGVLIIAFGALSLSMRTNWWAQWANCFVGIWLLFAPLVFWTPSPAIYANDTLVGSLVIAFSVLVPMMPGMSMQAMMTGPDIPPGWNYCPSTWGQRLPIITLAFIGFFLARYMSAYQLGHISNVWDPFFGSGTAKIITSETSRAWPIADAGLGAISYMLEVLMGFMGDKRRWRTMPWMVLMFGILVVPLGAVSIFFIIIQPIVIGTWCTLCLIAALAMLIMIPYALDELVAMGQFMYQAKREGQSLWQVFWHGGVVKGGAEKQGPPLETSPRQVVQAMARGVNIPWSLLLSALLGVWLMFTRLIFGTSGDAANSDHLVGSLVVTVAVIAMAEVARPLRFTNILLGVWLIIAPWVMDGASTIASWASVAVGVVLIVLSLPKGKVQEQYGGWNRFII